MRTPLYNLHCLRWNECFGCSGQFQGFDTLEKHGIIVPQITYEEFKHFAQAKGMLTEKYNRFNEYPKKMMPMEENYIYGIKI